MQEEKLIKTSELSEKWGVSREYIRRLRAEGMPCEIVTKRIILYNLSDCNDWRKQNKHASSGRPFSKKQKE